MSPAYTRKKESPKLFAVCYAYGKNGWIKSTAKRKISVRRLLKKRQRAKIAGAFAISENQLSHKSAILPYNSLSYQAFCNGIMNYRFMLVTKTLAANPNRKKKGQINWIKVITLIGMPQKPNKK